MIPDPNSRLFARLMVPELRLGLGLGLSVGGYGAPAASFNFLGGDTLDGRVTFTRASSATRVAPAGTIELVGSEVARFDYDPITLSAKGLLIEEQRTNVATNSGSLVDFNFGNRTANAATAPDGTITASLIKSNAGIDTGAGAVSFTYSGAAQTGSIFLKKSDAATTYISPYNNASLTATAMARVDWATDGTATASIISGSATIVVIPMRDGWYRLELTFADTASNSGYFFIYPETTSNGTATGKGVYAWGAQLEAGAFATSYIPTTSAQVTRAADLAVISGTAFSSWFNPATGTIACEFDVKSVTSVVNNPFLTVSSGLAANRIALLVSDATVNFAVVAANVVQAFFSPGTATAATTIKIAAVYGADDFAASLNGGAVGTDTIGVVPTVARMSLGSNAAGVIFMSGHIRRVDYYNRRLPNSDLQRLTA